MPCFIELCQTLPYFITMWTWITSESESNLNQTEIWIWIWTTRNSDSESEPHRILNLNLNHTEFWIWIWTTQNSESESSWILPIIKRHCDLVNYILFSIKLCQNSLLRSCLAHTEMYGLLTFTIKYIAFNEICGSHTEMYGSSEWFPVVGILDNGPS